MTVREKVLTKAPISVALRFCPLPLSLSESARMMLMKATVAMTSMRSTRRRNKRIMRTRVVLTTRMLRVMLIGRILRSRLLIFILPL